MKLTEQQKERYIEACKSAICRCLIPNITKFTVNLKDVKRPILSVYTRDANNGDDFHLDVVLTDFNSMRLYFKQVKFLYGETILGIDLKVSAHCYNFIDRTLAFILSDVTRHNGFFYTFGVVQDSHDLMIDSTTWHSLDNLKDPRFEPMNLHYILNEVGE